MGLDWQGKGGESGINQEGVVLRVKLKKFKKQVVLVQKNVLDGVRKRG